MQKAAGTSVFCGEVCNGLVGLGHVVTIAVANPYSTDRYSIDKRVALVSVDSLLEGRASSEQLQFNLIHIHALWSPILHKVSKWARHNKIPIVWSPHGMLTPWAMHNKWLKKQLGWWLYQRWDLVKADLIHVTAESEAEDVRRMGLNNNVVIAPLGVKMTDNALTIASLSLAKNTVRRLLFVSRVQKKKGLVNLVRAWAMLSEEIRVGWRVRIVGPDQEGHTAELKTLCNQLGVAEDFEFVGPKYGDELAKEYASADLFVLPTHSENFGSVVIEALAHGVPVICTKGAPWKELGERKCGWWIDVGVAPLAEALKKSFAVSRKSLFEMGVRGRKLVEEKYTWNAVVMTMVKGYEGLLKARE